MCDFEIPQQTAIILASRRQVGFVDSAAKRQQYMALRLRHFSQSGHGGRQKQGKRQGAAHLGLRVLSLRRS
jgi:hypothetical protein